jgi:S-DNA-T family DNA segregation ATPase FtsK/SpoIIIE
MAGAENLLKNGDILFIKTEERRPKRIQVPYISDEEINKVIEEVKNNNDKAEINKEIEQYINDKPKDIDNYDINGKEDPLLKEEIDTMITTGQTSTSFIQQRLKSVMQEQEEEGMPREVLATKDFDDTEKQSRITEQEEIILEELKDKNDKEENNYEIKSILKQWWFWVLIILLYIILKNL